jgi:hypothetical protein
MASPLLDAANALSQEAEILRDAYRLGGEDWHVSDLTSDGDIAAARREYEALLKHATTVNTAVVLLTEMHEAWAYFSEYCVPIGMKERIEALLGVQA